MYNSTIIIKKRLLKCGHTDYAFSRGRCKQCATIEDSLKRMNAVNESEEGLSDLIKECDALVSTYVRMKHSDRNGICKCYTCNDKKRWQEQQAGHYIPRANMLLRYDYDRNIRPQCEWCNCGKHGNLLIFAKNLEAEKEGITEILYSEAKIVYKYSRQELVLLKTDLTQKIKLLSSTIIK